MAFCQIRGDMQFLKELFMFKPSYRHDNCCHRCVANKKVEAFSYMNWCLPFAQWLNNLYSHDDILASIGEGICAIMYVDGFHCSRVMQDALHGLNLGPAAHLVGGVLAWQAGKHRQENLGALWNAFARWCEKTKLHIPCHHSRQA